MRKMNLKKSRSLMYVRRLNFERCNRYENVAEHSFYVGIMAYQLACAVGLDEAEARYCLKMGLMHDLAEAVTGDMQMFWNLHSISRKNCNRETTH